MDPKLFRAPATIASEPPSGERPLPPPKASPRELDLAAMALDLYDEKRKTNGHLEGIHAHMAIISKAGPAPRGYRWLVAAVVVLFAGEAVTVALVVRLAGELAGLTSQIAHLVR